MVSRQRREGELAHRNILETTYLALIFHPESKKGLKSRAAG